ncbi:hypothetical protein ACP70R_000508 [Stipagrostis hirtigluma subsp. patula]
MHTDHRSGKLGTQRSQIHDLNLACTPMDGAPMEVLLNRYVQVIDEVFETIIETGGLPLHETLETVVQALPECSSCEEREELEQAAMEAEIVRHAAEVAAPAYALLRERRASRPSAVRKEPVAVGCTDDGGAASYYGEVRPGGYTGDAAAFYSGVLDGVEPCLPPLAPAPSVASLAVRVSWPPNHPLLGCPSSAVVASCHDHLLALYVGPYRPGFPSLGFYLVYDTRASSAAVVPPLSTSRASYNSHCNIGTGVAVLRHGAGGEHGDYVLAELLLRKDRRSQLATNKATLFTWWSSGAGRWIQKDVLLPLPADPPSDEDTMAMPTYSFRADTVFAVGSTSLWWVDLLTGILVCDGIDKLAAAADDNDCPVFRFIPLPVECVIKHDVRRGQPEEYRSMSCIDSETFKFVSMDGYSQGRCISQVTLTTWTLKITESSWEWRKDEASFPIRELWDDPIYKNDLKLEPLTPNSPIISTVQDNVVYLSVVDYERKNGLLEATGVYELSLDMGRQRVTSAFKLPPSTSGGIQYPRIISTHLISSSSVNKTTQRNKAMQQNRDGEASDGLEEMRAATMSIPALARRCVVPTPPLSPCTPGSSSMGASTSSAVGLALLLDDR